MARARAGVLDLLEAPAGKGRDRLEVVARRFLDHADPGSTPGGPAPGRPEPFVFTYMASGAFRRDVELATVLRAPDVSILGDGVEVLDEVHVGVDHVLEDGVPIGRTVRRAHREGVEALATGLGRLRASWPDAHRVLVGHLHRVVLFVSESHNSFVTPRAPGVIFSNLALGRSAAFFFEELLHQGGHIVLAAAQLGHSSFLSVPGTTRVDEVAPRGRTDDRGIDDALHGVVTEGLMAEGLGRALDDGVGDVVDRHECAGRFDFIMRRFMEDLALFASADVLAPAGVAVLDALRVTARSLRSRHDGVLGRHDLSNQGYNFSFDDFLARHPLPTSARRSPA